MSPVCPGFPRRFPVVRFPFRVTVSPALRFLIERAKVALFNLILCLCAKGHPHESAPFHNCRQCRPKRSIFGFHSHAPRPNLTYLALVTVRPAYRPNLLTNHQCRRVHRCHYTNANQNRNSGTDGTFPNLTFRLSPRTRENHQIKFFRLRLL